MMMEKLRIALGVTGVLLALTILALLALVAALRGDGKEADDVHKEE